MMLREEKGGRTVCTEVREREREGEREREREREREKKEKAAGKGETGRTRQLPIDAGAFDSGAPHSADTGRWSQ